MGSSKSKGQPEGDGKLILVAGATGYIGRHLAKTLPSLGYRVRCLARSPETLSSLASDKTNVIQGDVLDRSTLLPALDGVHTAFYLVHSMDSGDDFVELDRRAANNFAAAAREAGIRRIIYLGGLGTGEQLSPHLASRQEVGEILRQSGIATIEFRASVIIGSGSLSFEMIRSLVEKLPIMIIPRWVNVLAQPIAIEDVICYLCEAIESSTDNGQIFEIGGPDRVSYCDIMREYGKQRGLHRLMIPVPVLTPHLSSLWLGLVTPLYVRIGRALIESIKHPTIVNDNGASDLFSVRPRSIRDAIKDALSAEDRDFKDFRAADKLSTCASPPRHRSFRHGWRIIDAYSVSVSCPPERAFEPIYRIGGKVGWYYANWLWRLRGLVDRMLGGVGMRRARRDPEHLKPGDTVDFWRVESYQVNRLLRLRAEMKLPGRAWLQLEVHPHTDGAEIHQIAAFEPLGLAGLVYWYASYPLHRCIFVGMIRALARQCVTDGCDGRENEA